MSNNQGYDFEVSTDKSPIFTPRNFFYLDIETLPPSEKPDFDDIKAPGQYKKQESIDKWKKENYEKIYREMALDSLKGRICCIGYALNDEPAKIVPYYEDESKIIEEFEEIVASIDYAYTMIWVGQNHDNFDLQWLFHRAIKYDYGKLASILPKHPRDKRIEEIADKFKGTAYKDYRSLDDIAAFLGFGNKTSHGSDVYDQFQKNDLQAIYDHCLEDIDLTRKIHKLLKIG